VLASITHSITSFVGNHGLYAVFVLMLIDAVFPAASELVMLYAGAVAAGVFSSAHHVSLFGAKLGFGVTAFVVMALAGTIGYLVGSLIGWAIGYYGGRPLLERRGRWLHLSADKLDRAERWFDKWGNVGVFLGRITPVIRSFVSIPAGVFRARLGRYTVLTFAGSTLWCVVFAAVGYAFGTRWETFHEHFHYVDYAVAAGIVIGVAYLLVRRRRSSTLSRRADPAR
jgi:membrane protein DedA with SNARE-associated domain